MNQLRGGSHGLLRGRWRKRTTAACAAEYPDHLEFFEGTYRGTRGEGQRDIVDDVAERARSLGDKAVGTLTEFLQATRLKEQPRQYPDARARCWRTSSPTTRP